MNFTEERMTRVYEAATMIERVLNNLDETTPGYAKLSDAFDLLEKAIVEYEDSDC